MSEFVCVVRDLRIKSQLPMPAIPAEAPGIRELVRTLLSIWPEFDWQRLIAGAGPDYLRQTADAPHLGGLEIGRNLREFQTAVRDMGSLSETRRGDDGSLAATRAACRWGGLRRAAIHRRLRP
jgi:hypothetical protein